MPDGRRESTEASETHGGAQILTAIGSIAAFGALGIYLVNRHLRKRGN